ncbi:glycosyl hydrolases family 16 domain-containing protein [Sarocladium implicatum]|nr:glycosyl hydrolases family 16 domain-containing protein [Sarocladium implicatum]
MHIYKLAGLVLPFLVQVQAQTSTKCNPTEKNCPTDKGLDQSSYNVDFTKGQSSDWNMTYGEADYDSSGVSFTIKEPKQAPTMQSDFYFFFGTVSAIAKAAKGTGIVSCVILESDDLDEIDWEWLGGDVNQVQTNYYGKGNTTTYNRGTYVDVDDSQDTWHNYTIEWTSSHTTWYIDGAAVRTLNFADAVGGTNYPQTPMRVRLGIWSASDTGAPGTIQWAGGDTNYADGPFTMHVKSISIQNYNPSSTYAYGDRAGDWQSIKMSSGKAAENESSEATSSTKVHSSKSSAHTPVSSSSKASSTRSSAHETSTAPATHTSKSKVTSSPASTTVATPSSDSLASSTVSTGTSMLLAVFILATVQML